MVPDPKQPRAHPRPPRVKIQSEGGWGEEEAGSGLEPRACLPSPYLGNRSYLFGHQPAGFELGQREKRMERGEPLAPPPNPRESRGDSLLPADALVLG